VTGRRGAHAAPARLPVVAVTALIVAAVLSAGVAAARQVWRLVDRASDLR